jgi:DNA-binding MarR family transcriptional regulator
MKETTSFGNVMETRGRGRRKNEKKEKIQQKTFLKNISKDPKKPICSKNSEGSHRGASKESLRFKEITAFEGEVLEKLAETFNAGLSSGVRIKMLAYCLEEHSFTDIIQALRLNPASLKHHEDLLQETGLIKKTGKGRDTRYRTTDLGEAMLSFAGEILQVVRTT